MSKKDIKHRTERVQQDAVTHQLVVTTLDDVQLAFERCVQVVEGKLLAINDPVKNERLIRKLIERLQQMIPQGGTKGC